MDFKQYGVSASLVVKAESLDDAIKYVEKRLGAWFREHLHETPAPMGSLLLYKVRDTALDTLRDSELMVLTWALEDYEPENDPDTLEIRNTLLRRLKAIMRQRGI